MTLIVAGNSSGVYGRCDARCHNATEPDCHCICGGRYHRLKSGSRELGEAVKQYGEEMAKRLKAEGADVRTLEEVLQRGFPAQQKAMF